MPGLYELHPFPGKLIVVEGIDGSGKSTQAQLLSKYLISRGVPVFFTEWNSSALVKSATKAGKKKGRLTPTTFSLLHATDFADRLNFHILPPLKAGMVVIADRFVYTAFARDTARGVDPQWVRNVYNFAWKPDLAFYFRVPVRVALSRLTSARAKIKYYEAGLDVGLSRDPEESFLLFQQRVIDRYDEMAEEFGMSVVDARDPIPRLQKQMRILVERQLKEYLDNYPRTASMEESLDDGGAHDEAN